MILLLELCLAWQAPILWGAELICACIDVSPGETSGSMILIIFILANSFLLWEWSTLLSSLLFEDKLFTTFLIRQVLYRGVHRLCWSRKPPFRIPPLLESEESENLQLFLLRREFPPCLSLQNVGGGVGQKCRKWTWAFSGIFWALPTSIFSGFIILGLSSLLRVIHNLFWALLCLGFLVFFRTYFLGFALFFKPSFQLCTMFYPLFR
jgi:hypothetical protein